MDVFGLIGQVVFLAYQEDCARCFLCDRVCPTEAIQIDAKPIIQYPDPFEDRK
jgi:NAD-dependent dihydropyrimidine dehydrogenase PreA subunit